jgi:S1-C subfamily serine protease
LLERAKRAFGGSVHSAVLARYRAVVGPVRSEDALVRNAFDKLQDGERPTPRELAALEQAIRAFRPSVIVREGMLGPLPEEAEQAFPTWAEFVEKVRKHINTIGRIDFERKTSLLEQDSVGTGFLVRPRVLLTNCHVLDALSMSNRVLERGQAVIHFKQDQTVPDEAPVPIVGVVGYDHNLDIAALEIDNPPADGRQPFEFEFATPSVGEGVVAIGYPFPDGERNPLFMDVAFSDHRYGIKRAAPGETLGVEDDLIYHDCSTLGGNSGSPLVSITTGAVIGLHRKGGFVNRNEAVRWFSLREFVDHLPQ